MTNKSSKTQWQYLEPRPHPWRKQLYVKGKRIKASVIYSDMMVNIEKAGISLANQFISLNQWNY